MIQDILYFTDESVPQSVMIQLKDCWMQCNALRCVAMADWATRLKVAATSKSCVITMFMCDLRIFFSLISPITKHFTDKTGEQQFKSDDIEIELNLGKNLR